MNITGKKTMEINRAGVARTFQNIRLFKELTVLDNVKAGLHNQYSYSAIAGILRLPKYFKVEKTMDEKAVELLKVFDLDREKDIMIGRYRVLLTHGHYYSVSLGPERLIKEARAGGFDIVMYGHTHRPFYEVDKKDGDKDLIVLNPGSLSYPRQDGHRPSYMLMDIDRDGEAQFSLNYLER